MTDQRARAVIARYDLVDVNRCGEGWQEMQRDDQYGDWVQYEDHIAALADAERGVWEEAAKICDERAKYYKSIKSVGDIHDWVVERLAEEIRAKAHAGQEGG